MRARSTFVDDGVRVTSARLDAFTVNELAFPPSHAHRIDPERGYVAFFLEGGLEKTFAHGTRTLSAGAALTMPAGAAHATKVGTRPTRVIVLHPAEDGAASIPWASLLGRLRETREGARHAAAWRLAAELRARDDAWALAAEALCLDLVAGLIRGSRPAQTKGARPWLDDVRERLHASLGARLTLAELAEPAGVHPVYLARSFRERYGVSVGEYVRQLRLDWAAAQLTATDTPVAAVAADAGFADQSHFTRAFKRHTGLTPGRYRRVVRQ